MNGKIVPRIVSALVLITATSTSCPHITSLLP
jgi:hypothetical protein